MYKRLQYIGQIYLLVIFSYFLDAGAALQSIKSTTLSIIHILPHIVKPSIRRRPATVAVQQRHVH